PPTAAHKAASKAIFSAAVELAISITMEAITASATKTITTIEPLSRFNFFPAEEPVEGSSRKSSLEYESTSWPANSSDERSELPESLKRSESIVFSSSLAVMCLLYRVCTISWRWHLTVSLQD